MTHRYSMLAALAGVSLVILGGYAYWYAFSCKAAAQRRFSQIVLTNSHAFQNDLDRFVGQEGAGRAVIENSVAFNQLVSYLADTACTCVDNKINSSNSTPGDLAFQECIEEVRSKP